MELELNNTKENIHLILDSLERNLQGKTYLDIHIKNTGTTLLKLQGELNNSFWNN